MFPVAAKEGGSRDLVGEAIDDGTEGAGDGRVILGSLTGQDGGKDVGMIDGDDKRDGAALVEAAPIPCLSSPL